MAKPKTEYEKLKAIWYKKLTASGFNDIEQDDNNLKTWSYEFAREKSLHSWQAKAAYYCMAEQLLNEPVFEDRLEKNVWAYHAEGLSARNIHKILKKARITDKRVSNKDKVWAIIHKLETIMKKLNGVVYDNE